MIYDWTITSGGAIKEVQKLLDNQFEQNITIDGSMGTLTVNAINNVADQDKLLKSITKIRKEYYTYLTFTKGINTQDILIKKIHQIFKRGGRYGLFGGFYKSA